MYRPLYQQNLLFLFATPTHHDGAVNKERHNASIAPYQVIPDSTIIIEDRMRHWLMGYSDNSWCAGRGETRCDMPPYIQISVALHNTLYHHQIMTYPTNNIAPRPIFNALSTGQGFGRRNRACIDVATVISKTTFSPAAPACRGVVVNDEWHYLQISSYLVIPGSNIIIDGRLGQ